MADKKADYGDISDVYDDARRPNAPHVAWWVAKLAAEGNLGKGKRLIELGCGTGRWTTLLAKRTGCEAVGLDRSREMLDKARAKDQDGRVTWVEGNCEDLTLETESFDCALMSLVIHHLDDHATVLANVLRLLRPGGVCLIRQATLEQIVDGPWFRFFPEIVTIDRKRVPFRCEIEHWMKSAGFNPVRVDVFKQRSYETNMQLLEEFQKRVTSSLRMISDGAYEAGMARLMAHLRRHTDDPTIRESLFTLFAGRKPE